MFINITGIDLFDQNSDMACANIRLRCSYEYQTGIDLFDLNVGMACANVRLRCSCDNITGIDLFDQNRDVACVEIRLRCSWILLILIYLIKMWVWHVPMLDSGVQ